MCTELQPLSKYDDVDDDNDYYYCKSVAGLFDLSQKVSNHHSFWHCAHVILRCHLPSFGIVLFKSGMLNNLLFHSFV